MPSCGRITREFHSTESNSHGSYPCHLLHTVGALVDFKLHAPHLTVVEGKVRGGRVIQLNVTPESRRHDVIYPDRT